MPHKRFVLYPDSDWLLFTSMSKTKWLLALPRSRVVLLSVFVLFLENNKSNYFFISHRSYVQQHRFKNPQQFILEANIPAFLNSYSIRNPVAQGLLIANLKVDDLFLNKVK